MLKRNTRPLANCGKWRNTDCLSGVLLSSDNSDYGSLLMLLYYMGIQGGCLYSRLSQNGGRGKRCNIGEVSSLHILVVGNVITVRLQEGDYGNPFVPIYARVGEW